MPLMNPFSKYLSRVCRVIESRLLSRISLLDVYGKVLRANGVQLGVVLKEMVSQIPCVGYAQ